MKNKNNSIIYIIYIINIQKLFSSYNEKLIEKVEEFLMINN